MTTTIKIDIDAIKEIVESIQKLILEFLILQYKRF